MPVSHPALHTGQDTKTRLPFFDPRSHMFSLNLIRTIQGARSLHDGRDAMNTIAFDPVILLQRSAKMRNFLSFFGNGQN